ncbi:hypothetical protein BASA61_001648 [Batrachochytrium salamandrivorans]|nr:hypothetical protein BASA61_001648 [Batrachochytrium salamandrivorans]KAH9272442.1 hypothetical protein BASA83_005249 [Batrachochytrium salamandrivorans]
MVAAIPIGTHARAIYDTQQDQGTSMPFFSSESHSKPRPPPFGLSLSLQATSSPYQCILVTTPDHDIGSTDHYSELGTEGDLGKNDQLKSEMVLDSYGDQNSSIGDRDPHQEDLNGQLPWSPAATLSHNISTSGSRLDGPILAPQPPSHSSLLHVADSSSLPGPSLMSGLDGSHRQIISCNESASDPNCLEANADLYIMDESSQPVFRHVMGSMTYNESSVWIHEWADAIMIAMGGTGSLDAAQSRLGRVDTSGGSGFIEHHYRVDQGGDKSISYGTWPTANTIAITATTADDPIAIENDTSIGVDSPVVAGVRLLESFYHTFPALCDVASTPSITIDHAATAGLLPGNIETRLAGHSDTALLQNQPANMSSLVNDMSLNSSNRYGTDTDRLINTTPHGSSPLDANESTRLLPEQTYTFSSSQAMPDLVHIQSVNTPLFQNRPDPPHHQPKVSFMYAVARTMNNTLGVGILMIPYALYLTGWIVGVSLLLLFGVLINWTVWLVDRCCLVLAHQHQQQQQRQQQQLLQSTRTLRAFSRPILPESDRLFVMRDPSNRTRVRWDPLSPVSKLVLHMFGYHAYIVMVTAEMLLYFGACVSIMLAIVTMWVGPCSPDASSLMTGTITSSSMIGWSDAICVVAWPSTQMEIRVRALWVRVGLPLLVMPLLMTAPRMRRNSFGMFIGVGGSVIVMTIVVGLVAAVGVDMTDLAFAGGSSHHGELAHGPLPKVYGRMRNPLPLSRVISMSFGILTTLYIVCGACGYVVFGQDVLPLLPQSLLNSAGKYVLGVRTAIAMLLLSLLLKYTTVLNTFCSRIEQCLYDGSDRDAIRTNDDEGFTVSVREHWKSHLVMRVGISVLMAYLMALLTNVAAVMGTVVAVLGIPVVIIMPFVCYLRLFWPVLGRARQSGLILCIIVCCLMWVVSSVGAMSLFFT